MPVDRWDRIQSVFLSLVDLPPEDQTHQLDTACADDCELRAEVESLLKSDRESAQTISSAIATEAALWSGTRALIGDRLGAYRVVKELGRGGMGAVYLAIRDDDQFQKQVAIKVVKHGMDTEEVLGRFRHERQILANLDHPNIARLLDGGTTFDGRPFFVMDYVEGHALDIYAGERKLDIETRCRLFLRILEAVAYAHRNLVVHRDLKPSNIFVTGDGSPKLLDFGVAKLLAADYGPGVTVTSVARPFTPEYACPEQVRGLPAATTADIYSLGAVFYELLTGRRAQPIIALTPAEIERVICYTEVTRPGLLVPGLDGDLDNIVLMAMRKEPERRYQSVDQFAEDVRRYLSGRPVLARYDSFWYRTRKFTWRNRFQIAGTALIFASLLAALLVTLSQSRLAQSARHAAEAQRTVAERERARAESGFQQAEVARAAETLQRLSADRQRDEAVRERAEADLRLKELLNVADKTLFEIHDVVARLPGATEARQTLVRTTLDYLENIRKEHGLDDPLRLALSAGYSRIAAIQGDPTHPSLGDFEGARDSYQKAEALLSPLYTRRKNDPEAITRWLEIESALADLSFRHLQRDQGIQMYLRLLPVAHKLAEFLPSDRQAVKQEAAIHGDLAIALQSVDRIAALDHANRQIAIISSLIDRFPEDRDLKQELGSSLAAAAASIGNGGDLEKAAEYFERSIRIREQFLEVEPHNALVQRNLLVAYGNYATLLGIPWSANMGRFAEARSYCEKSIALARELAGADQQDMTARYDLGVSLGRLGMVEPEPLKLDPEQVAESLKSLEEALRILDPISRANPNSSSMTLQVAMVREYAGFRLRSLGRPAAAVESFRQSLAELELMIDANPGAAIGIREALIDEEGIAGIYAAQGDRAAALTRANHAVDRAEKYSGASPGKAVPSGYLGDAYFELASVERTLGDWDRAADAAGRAVALWRTINDPGVISVHRQARERAEALALEIAAHRAK